MQENPATDVSVSSLKKCEVVRFGAGLAALLLVGYLSRDEENEVHVVSGVKAK